MQWIRNKRINVTKTDLPELAELILYLDKIWKSEQVTNNGQIVQELEQELQ